MRILFDQGTPVPLRQLLSSHQIETVFEHGWSTLQNGELLAKAEEENFDVFLTTDKNLPNQQNVSKRSLAIVVLSSTSWPRIQKAIAAIKQAIEAALPGTSHEVNIP